MPQKITQYSIWRKFIPRFGIEPGGLADDAPSIDELIYPVTNVDRLMEEYGFQGPTIDLTGTLGDFVTVMGPGVDNRRTIVHVWREATTGVSRLTIRYQNLAGSQVAIPISVAGTGEEVVLHPITLEAGDLFGMEATGNGADTAIDVKVRYVIETIPRI